MKRHEELHSPITYISPSVRNVGRKIISRQYVRIFAILDKISLHRDTRTECDSSDYHKTCQIIMHEQEENY
jgi:saccharopine dehydrogenase-like NADP-dependent oxidoreductase